MLEPSREEAIFCDAVEVPIRERLEFLQKACAGDRELLTSVERLLLIHDTEDDFLATPAIGLMPDEINEQPGDVIGCYQLEQKIGEGGFGVVWQADQLEPVKRKVALKIVKLGMDSERIVRRFDEERQTLAIMNHPNIATVLDAGTTTAGRPFFAMELVEGQSLDEFCLENDLSLSQRLGIFITVCRAVQHAHQKGIVHRDLKPSNILISSDDSDIIPKVIDFGIAKAIRDKGVIDAASDGPPIGTPQYMSPEQFSNESDVDSRSDIYSLGVILYQLLTGCGPGEDFLLNEQPLLPPPQKRLLNVNGFRPVATGELNPAMQVEKELDWIAQKALSKDREDRYQSASEFAMDVERYMQCQPVSAGPSSAFYQVKKFFQRNKLLVGSAFTVLLATVVAALALTFGLLHANHQRKIANQQKWVAQQERQEAEWQKTIAEDEAEEARLVAGVLKKMVSGANPSTSNPSDYSLREHLDEVTKSLDQLADHPEVEAELRTTAAKAYHNLSQMRKAEIQYKRALDLRLSTLGEDHASTLKSRIGYASCLCALARVEEAESEIETVLAGIRDNEPDRVYLDAIAILKRIRLRQRRFKEAFELAEERVQLSRALNGRNHKETLDSLSSCASAAEKVNRLDDAEEMARESLDILIRKYPAKQFQISNARFRLAGILVKLQHYAEAKDLASSVFEQQTLNLGETDPHVIQALAMAANIHFLEDDIPTAEKYARDAVARAERLPDNQIQIRATVYRRLAVILQPNKPEDSSEAWKKSIEFRYHALGDNPQVASHLLKRACLLSELKRLDESAECVKRAIEMLEQLEKVDSLTTSAYKQYSELLSQLGQPELADKYQSKANELLKTNDIGN